MKLTLLQFCKLAWNLKNCCRALYEKQKKLESSSIWSRSINNIWKMLFFFSTERFVISVKILLSSDLSTRKDHFSSVRAHVPAARRVAVSRRPMNAEKIFQSGNTYAWTSYITHNLAPWIYRHDQRSMFRKSAQHTLNPSIKPICILRTLRHTLTLSIKCAFSLCICEFISLCGL